MAEGGAPVQAETGGGGAGEEEPQQEAGQVRPEAGPRERHGVGGSPEGVIVRRGGCRVVERRVRAPEGPDGVGLQGGVRETGGDECTSDDRPE
ncbi:hypothetical protein GCM10009827_000590 [Dactylosporangium maewongense]|uniref:Uncharacterized protein n=1 Tax=Dactylosporangium maewongense TaxID=634393 RepID=A0ABN1ZHL8_9ACTN